jgi:hypothetical protein
LDTGRTLGGICKLRELIEEHPRELAFDFRNKFGLSYLEIGFSVTYLEAVYLVSALMTEPDSHLQAVANEWNHPVSREWIVLTHVYDLLAAVNSKRPKPYPTPWPNPNVAKIRPKQNLDPKEVLRNLERMNPPKE